MPRLPPIRLQLGAGDVSPSYAGMVAADEPEAVLVARDILKAGGTAADAAAAMGFALTVTLPSSAGLGGSGACVVHDAVSGTTEALDFTPRAAADTGAARYRAAIPALPRGLFALHAKYSKLPWAQVVAPSEKLARFGHTVSRAFAQDLTTDGGVLVNDTTALKTFMTPRRQTLQIGDVNKQIDLATTLGRLRAPGELYAGTFGSEIEDAIVRAGGAITAADLQGYVPQWVPAHGWDEGTARIFALPTEVGGGDFQNAFAAPSLPPDEATSSGATSFVVADDAGSAVACAVGMGRPFGLGIMPPGAGFLLAPSPEMPGAHHSLAAVIAINNTNNKLTLAAAAAGDEAISRTAALAHTIIVDRRAPFAETAIQRRGSLVNMLTCRLVESTCRVQNDPAGAGYAVAANPKE